MANKNPSPDTQFPKGVSGNPGGKSAEREELRRWLREEFGRDAIEGIARMAGLRVDEGHTPAESAKVRLDAYKWLGEQSIGRAVQAISDPNGNPISLFDFSGLTPDQLVQLESIRKTLKPKP